MKEHAFFVSDLDYTIKNQSIAVPLVVFLERSVSNNSDPVDPVLWIQTIYYNEEQAVWVYLGENRRLESET